MALQYLTITRLDSCFVVNKLSQFMHKPSQLHFQALKKVLHYLKGTIHHGIVVGKEPSLNLVAYSDSD